MKKFCKKCGFPCALQTALGSLGIVVKCTTAIYFLTEDCFYISMLRTQIHTPLHARARALSNKKTMIGQTAITIALAWFNGLGRSVKLSLLYSLQFSSHCPVWKMSKRSLREDKKYSRFLSTGHRTVPPWGCKTRETAVAKCERIL